MIVGAGPAGLSAALYAARFCRSTLVLHDGAARAARIPLTHNVPGFEDGVAGADLLQRMSRHAQLYAATIVNARVTAIRHAEGSFKITDANNGNWSARAVILATGVVLNEIPLEKSLHEAAIAAGVLRYCPVCDGFEHKGARIAVLGCDISGASEAVFLTRFSRDVTLLTRCDVELTEEEQADLERAGVRIVTDAVSGFEPRDNDIWLHLEGRSAPLAFDVLYPALGSRPRNRLAQQLGLKLNDAGNVSDSSPLGTQLPGLYCAGDLVDGLDQISVAMGQGAIAATKAHNWLRERDGETAQALLGQGKGGGHHD